MSNQNKKSCEMAKSSRSPKKSKFEQFYCVTFFPAFNEKTYISYLREFKRELEFFAIDDKGENFQYAQALFSLFCGMAFSSMTELYSYFRSKYPELEDIKYIGNFTKYLGLEVRNEK